MSKPSLLALTDGQIVHMADLNTPIDYLQDSSNTYGQWRNGSFIGTTDSNGQFTVTYTAFPTACGFPVASAGDIGGSIIVPVATSVANGSFKVQVYVVTAGALVAAGSGGGYRCNYFVGGN